MKKLIIGLTGGIGSGKTTASNWFAEKGITIVDADVVAREIVAPNSPTLQSIASTFGSWALHDDGTLNRETMRKHIFSSNKARKQLENIMHPAINTRIQTQLSNSKSNFAILVAPLLLEGNLHSICQRILVVDVPEILQLQRASQRDGQTPEQINQIIQSQMSRKDKIYKADDVIDNSKDEEHLYEQLDLLLTSYNKLASAFNNQADEKEDD